MRLRTNPLLYLFLFLFSTGLWDMQEGFLIDASGENPFLLGNYEDIQLYKKEMKEDIEFDESEIDFRFRPFEEAINSNNPPTMENPGNYYGNLFRLIFGIDQINNTDNQITNNNLQKSDRSHKRYSNSYIDHELMYAICKVLTEEGIAGYGAPLIGQFPPEIMLCHPKDVLISINHNLI